ncbi:MAG: GAF domain-containing protein [bacterium]
MEFHKNWIRIVVVVLQVTIIATGSFYLSSVWGNRLLIIGILLLGAFLIPPMYTVVPGVLSIPSDLVLSGQQITSLDFIVWAVFLGVPYWLGGVIEHRKSEETSSDQEQSEYDLTSSTTSSGTGTLTDENLSPDTLDDNVLPDMIRDFFASARESLGFDNLIYFHVIRKQASIGYVIDSTESINRDCTFRYDTGQGVGWVLRHHQQLVQRGSQIDWRNLQYHRHRVDLEMVLMEPIEINDELSGVMVLEWESEPPDEAEECDEFINRAHRLMKVERHVRNLEKKQRVLSMTEKIHELDPLEEPDFEGMIHRSIELIESFIPADEVEFYRYESGDDNSVVHQGKRALYEQCMDWIKNSEEILRISDVNNHSLGGKQIDRFGKSNIRSFLGGPVSNRGELVGMICLSHDEPGYFTNEDERLLRLLLERLSQVLRIGRNLRDTEHEQQELKEWINFLSDPSTGNDLVEEASRIGSFVTEKLPVTGNAIYWRNPEGRYQLLTYQGQEPHPTETLENQHTLVKRIKNAGISTTLAFPDVNKLDSFEAGGSAQSMRIIPARREETLKGFMVSFLPTPDHLERSFNDLLTMVGPTMVETLLFIDRTITLSKRLSKDPLSGILRFDTWKQTLSNHVRDHSDEKLVIWLLEAEGYEEIIEQRGRDRAINWLRSIATSLLEDMNDSEIARSHGSVFMGFTFDDPDNVATRLKQVEQKLADWSFPTGQWPVPPQSRYVQFSPPFPRVKKMIRSALQTPVKETAD